MIFTYDVYATPKQGKLVLLLGGYKPMRVPIQLGNKEIEYTAFQTIDPAYI